MPRVSAGLLIHRLHAGGREVLLVHPGGPLWAKKDMGAWQIPKGLVEPGEEIAAAARREAGEELGLPFDGPLIDLGSIRQSGGKLVHAFAWEGEVDADAIRSNLFEMEWPPRSGRLQSFPEVDRARWLSLEVAATLILPSQLPLLDRLAGVIG